MARLFEPYKTIGLISSRVPHLIRYVDQLNKLQIITAVGRSFLVFNEKLQLLETCVAHSDEITLLASDSTYLFTAAGDEIFAWKYGHKMKVKCFKQPERQSRLVDMIVFGGQLLAIDEHNTLLCWDISNQELSSIISFGDIHDSSSIFIVSSMIHPATYINKILLGSRQGKLQLWNISKQKLLYEFGCLTKSSSSPSSIICMAQAPALHVIAIGHQSGLIVLHHLKEDVSLMRFIQELGPVNGISFRTDDTATLPLMVTCSNQSGHLALWNLEEKRLEQQMSDSHSESITSVTFINKQPLMVTNSDDNSLKVFVFDHLQTTGRLLYQREGHQRPPTRIKFYGDKNQTILSAGLDSTLRSFNIHSERLNRSLGLASMNRKLAKRKGVQHDPNVLMPVVDFAVDTIRSKEWDNVIACHRNTAFVTTWSTDHMKMGRHKLIHKRFQNLNVQAETVSMSSCGNFVLVGYSSGHLDRFNIQSGLHRASYVDRDIGEETRAHHGPIRSVICDAFNQMVISGSTDRLVKVWHFSPKSNRRQQLIGTLKIQHCVNRMTLHRENQFIAISLDDHSVLVMDLETKKIVRSFNEHGNRVNDMTFDYDCRRLLVACMDSLIYIWDMLSGQLVDLIATETPCVSLTLSPSGEFLATAHVNDLAIYLWSNVSVYTKVTLQPLNLAKIKSSIPVIRMPTIQSDETGWDEQPEVKNDSNDNVDGGGDEDNEKEHMDYKYLSPEQLSRQLVTLSNVSQCQWKNLLQIDLIRRRNQPKQPIQKPKTAPFLLPSIPGLQPKFDLTKSTDLEETEPIIAAMKNNYQQNLLISPFARLIDEHFRSNTLTNLFEQLKQFGPSKIDAEIRSLGVESTGSDRYMLCFTKLISSVIKTNRDFELANTYFALFLKIHMDSIGNNSKNNTELLEEIEQISLTIERKWYRLQAAFDRSICLVNFLRNALI